MPIAPAPRSRRTTVRDSLPAKQAVEKLRSVPNPCFSTARLRSHPIALPLLRRRPGDSLGNRKGRRRTPAARRVKLRDKPRETLAALDHLRDFIGIERILWGTDFPHMRQHMSLKDTVDIYRRLPALAHEHGYRFTDGEAEAVLGGNAARVLGMGA